MATREEAEAALFDAIGACAASAVEKKDGDLLKVAAEAFREVVHGPQGGAYVVARTDKTETFNRNETQSRTNYSSDYHETHHPDGEPRRKPGFAEDEPPTREMTLEHDLPSRSG